MNTLLQKIKEVFFSVLPITVIVLILHFTVTPLSSLLLIRFLIGAVFIILGLSIFLAGVDVAISPLGNHIGASLSKTNKLWIVAAVGLVLGFFISLAEPDLQILAAQVSSVTGGQITSLVLLIVVSLGIGIMLVMGLIRIVYNFPLYKILMIVYGLILLLSLFVSPELLAISFDASGATTGALTVPFILALAMGVSVLKKDSKASEKDSFGLVAVTSTGAILGVLLMGIFSKIGHLSGSIEHGISKSPLLLAPFADAFSTVLFESFIALIPLFIIFLLFQIKVFHFDKKHFIRMLKGFLYAFIGLVLFLVGVNAGFLDVGTALGYNIALLDHKIFAVLVGLVLGVVTILAEPAVHVLTQQIETVTSGYVKRKVVLAALSVGVGLAVALSILRIVVPEIELWHYLLPGYILCIFLSFFTPKLFVGIGFDSGGVASGPMTATFILAFAQGVADAIAGADVLKDAFGMIALVAMTPIITLQILGLIFKIKSRKKDGEKSMICFELICCVVNHGQGSKTLRIAKQHGVKGGTIFLGRGTVKNRLLEFLDLNDIQKEIVFMSAEKPVASEAIKALNGQMAFHKPHHGIGFSLPLQNFIGTKHHEYYNDSTNEVKDMMYNAIFTVVDKGLAEEVVTAATKAGAKGGTIINARGSGIHETSVLFAMPIEPEKELVMVLAENDSTEAIATSIREDLHIDEPGHGVIFVVALNEVYGII